ncbi:unnamed protein product [Pleuronectes platessa]|uniref:Uncharacterized protein n=1 Tax=Pleuronectes platessa TaxID=8262 RepID=A0A9N7UXW7_PLEPL|nr:unnamed protein product [Pleuronectes platessa]
MCLQKGQALFWAPVSPSYTSRPPAVQQMQNAEDCGLPASGSTPTQGVVKSSTTTRLRLLMEAVIRWSYRVLTGLATAGKPCHTEEDTTSLLHPMVASIPHAGAATRCSPRSPKPGTPLLPFILPNTLIIGDSIMRSIRFINAVTHCFPGATTPEIIGKLPGLIASFVGSKDTSRQQSELTIADYIRPFAC